MTKEELKNYIKQLSLESDLEGMVFEIIDNTKEVTAELLNGIADILDLQADFYEKVADVLEDEARTYDSLNAEFSSKEEAIKGARMEEIGLLQEEFTNEIAQKLQAADFVMHLGVSATVRTKIPKGTVRAVFRGAANSIWDQLVKD